jgi:Glycosyltransferase 61
MVRKRWRMQETMLVPAQWSGSVEHFYHFFFGYFMPLVLWQEKTGSTEFTVRDCGPMNSWFELLKEGSQPRYIPPGVMLQRVLTHRQEMQTFRGWDNPLHFHRKSLNLFSTTILNRVGIESKKETHNEKRITVLDRKPSPDFYVADNSEVLSSGAAWRSMPNTERIAEALQNLGEVTLVDSAAMSPTEQVRLFSQTNLLVAQHGAGLSNMVWLPKNAAVLEIKPPLPPVINEIFSNLASACAIDRGCVDQADEHAEVDPQLVKAAAEELISSPGTHIPMMSGRLPIRILRQLPRRL